MKLSNINCARSVRDGGIDAMAALAEALREAMVGLPVEEQNAMKHAFGRAMGCVMTELIDPTIGAFPGLDPDDAAWIAVVKTRAAERARRSS